MTDPDAKFTDEELTIWRAAYGTAFAAQFEEMVMAESFQTATRHLSSGRAITVADTAVRRLREWRAQNSDEAKAGVELRTWSHESAERRTLMVPEGLPLAEAKAAVRREMERRGMTPEGS